MGPRVRARSRQGRCFELAGKGQQRDPSWILVHGTIYGWIAHAWLEKDGTAYDAVIDRFVPVPQYEREFDAIAERRYGPREAAEAMLSGPQGRHTWGPWHESAGNVQGLLVGREK